MAELHPFPWHVSENIIMGLNLETVFDASGHYVAGFEAVRTYSPEHDLLKFIVAAANFCANYPSEFLAEMGSLGKLIDHCRRREVPDLELTHATITDYNRFGIIAFQSPDAPAGGELHALAEARLHYTVKVYREE